MPAPSQHFFQSWNALLTTVVLDNNGSLFPQGPSSLPYRKTLDAIDMPHDRPTCRDAFPEARIRGTIENGPRPPGPRSMILRHTRSDHRRGTPHGCFSMRLRFLRRENKAPTLAGAAVPTGTDVLSRAERADSAGRVFHRFQRRWRRSISAAAKRGPITGGRRLATTGQQGRRNAICLEIIASVRVATWPACRRPWIARHFHIVCGRIDTPAPPKGTDR